MKKLLFILLFIPFASSGQHPNKPKNPDADFYCSNNYEWYYDSSYSKLSIKIELDAIVFLEWVLQYYERAGTAFFSDEPGKQTMWRLKGKKLKGWDVGFTTKELWLRWYKEDNACWWE